MSNLLFYKAPESLATPNDLQTPKETVGMVRKKQVAHSLRGVDRSKCVATCHQLA